MFLVLLYRHNAEMSEPALLAVEKFCCEHVLKQDSDRK